MFGGESFPSCRMARQPHPRNRSIFHFRIFPFPFRPILPFQCPLQGLGYVIQKRNRAQTIFLGSVHGQWHASVRRLRAPHARNSQASRTLTTANDT